jgi:Antitoxin to bacterial toxin RNase LS or RnlA
MTKTKSFTLQKGPSKTFPLIGFSLSSERPEAFLPKMEKELQRKAYQGLVLIDTLACNGVSSRRYFVGQFDGEHIVHSSLKVANSATIDQDTQAFCHSFYAHSPEVLDKSVLTSAQKFKLTRG